MTEPVASAKKKQGFQKGRSGNPAGRKPGTRNKATVAAQTLIDADAKTITEKCIALAKEGDSVALKLVMDRLVPPRRDAPVKFSAPKLESAADAATALGNVLDAVAGGVLTPDEAESVGKLISGYVAAINTVEFDLRLRALEESKNDDRQ